MRYQRTEKHITPMVIEIQQLLANLHIHYQNVRNFHWNVSGPHFLVLHKHFEELYNFIAQTIDEAAERLLAIGASPEHTLQAYIDMAQIEEQVHLKNAWAMVTAIQEGNETIIANLEAIVRAADQAGDMGSSDMFVKYISELEKQNWMLCAMLNQ